MTREERGRIYRRAALGLTSVVVIAGLAAMATRFGATVASRLTPPGGLTAVAARLVDTVASRLASSGGPGRPLGTSAGAERDGPSGPVPDAGASAGAWRHRPADTARLHSRPRPVPATDTRDDPGAAPAARPDARAGIAPGAPGAGERDVANREVATADAGDAELAFTLEARHGLPTYLMNGAVVEDPGVAEHRDGPVEAGFEYWFGPRGLEKVKVWEWRR